MSNKFVNTMCLVLLPLGVLAFWLGLANRNSDSRFLAESLPIIANGILTIWIMFLGIKGMRELRTFWSKSSNSASTLDGAETKTCPACISIVPAAATKCRHWQSDLAPYAGPVTAPSADTARKRTVPPGCQLRDFKCGTCDLNFDEVVRASDDAGKTVPCPSCGSTGWPKVQSVAATAQ